MEGGAQPATAKSFVSRAHDKRLSSFALVLAYFKLGGLANGGETGAVAGSRRYVLESSLEAAETSSAVISLASRHAKLRGSLQAINHLTVGFLVRYPVSLSLSRSLVVRATQVFAVWFYSRIYASTRNLTPVERICRE